MAAPLDGDFLGSPDDAFGAQQILKRERREQPFSAYTEIAGFVTNNVALSRKDPQQDTFLVATFGLGYQKSLAQNLQFDVAARGAVFRYQEYSTLDFNSIDTGAGLTWTPPQLGGVALYARYNYTNLVSRQSGDTFFENHTLTLGGQKAWSFSRAHGAFVGAAAQWGFADPELAQRDEYSLYAGYQLQATRHLQASLFYRYGWYVYREEGDRRDHNNSLSLNLRYEFNPYLSVSASSFLGLNSSNQEVFDYDVWNNGLSLGVSLKF